MFHFAYFVSLQGMDEVSSCLQGSDHECELNNWNFPPFTPRKCHLFASDIVTSRVENNLSSTQCGQGQFHFPGSGPPYTPTTPPPGVCTVWFLPTFLLPYSDVKRAETGSQQAVLPLSSVASSLFTASNPLTWFSFKLCENIRILQGTNYLPLK